jgi:hypothetical protein
MLEAPTLQTGWESHDTRVLMDVRIGEAGKMVNQAKHDIEALGTTPISVWYEYL